jgi:hypothetical protein
MRAYELEIVSTIGFLASNQYHYHSKAVIYTPISECLKPSGTDIEIVCSNMLTNYEVLR